ncbi:MAG: anti-sigma factor antagonist [Solirubrobacteraceae bacterium]|jgi:anti-sigma B factor antagonist
MATEDGLDRQAWEFEITVVATPDPGQICVRLKGELDIATVPVARDRIADLKHKASDVILDLRELSFIDSSGLNLVLQLAAESTRDGWNLALIPGSRAVQRIFELTGTQERLPFRSPRANGRRLDVAD